MARRITVPEIVSRKGKEKIVALTAYDYTMAKVIDAAGVDIILVGDSAAMVCGGAENTLEAELEIMLAHTKWVARAVSRALMVGDMPFGSYQASLQQGIDSAVAFLKAGAHAVKIEGGKEFAQLISQLVSMGIPVMGHVGMMPQRVHAYGGFGKRNEESILEDALAVEEAGAFSVVLEQVPSELAALISSKLRVPTIGIGAGPSCAGQVLVCYDMLGMNPDFKPKFLKTYMDGWSAVKSAVQRYAREVKNGEFPGPEQS